MPSQPAGQPASQSTTAPDCLMREGAARQRHGMELEGSQYSDKGRGKVGGMATEFQKGSVPARGSLNDGLPCIHEVSPSRPR